MKTSCRSASGTLEPTDRSYTTNYLLQKSYFQLKEIPQAFFLQLQRLFVLKSQPVVQKELFRSLSKKVPSPETFLGYINNNLLFRCANGEKIAT